jgi:hypothetical protein
MTPRRKRSAGGARLIHTTTIRLGGRQVITIGVLEHDAEKWIPLFQKIMLDQDARAPIVSI